MENYYFFIFNYINKADKQQQQNNNNTSIKWMMNWSKEK